MDTIAEGFGDGAVAESRRFLKYAQRSCAEVQSRLHRAFDCTYISHEQFDRVYGLATQCRKQIKGFRTYLRDRGADYGVAEEAIA